MPVRRSRTEQLELRPAGGGPNVVLFFEERGAGELTTQDVFQVSPDGAFLAYAKAGALRVRAQDGSERAIAGYGSTAHMRFSPDSKYLAAIVGEHRAIAFDLATGTTSELATLPSVSQLEWLRDGLVVQVHDPDHQHDALVELSLAGKATTLLERPAFELDKFVAAATGTRVVAFVHDHERTAMHVLALDATAPAGVHELGTVHDSITNAAATLDGGRVAFTTPLALFVITGDDKPQAISSRDGILSLWFAHDGRLGYASPASVTILDGTRARRFDTDGPISMLRFDPQSSAALVAAAHAWDVSGDHPQRLAAAVPGSELLGVDRFAGGLVLWTR